jgi:hypothetical protein
MLKRFADPGSFLAQAFARAGIELCLELLNKVFIRHCRAPADLALWSNGQVDTQYEVVTSIERDQFMEPCLNRRAAGGLLFGNISRMGGRHRFLLLG